MKLSILSLKRTLFDGEAKSLNCKTELGEITVLDNHRALITMLRGGIMKVVDANDTEHFVPVKNGFLEVKDGNQARAMVEEAG